MLGWQRMKVAVDTNVLVRAVVRDDPAQASVATKILTDAESIHKDTHGCTVGKTVKK